MIEPAQRRVCLPALDGELTVPLTVLEEILLALSEDDPHPPALMDGGEVLRATQRLAAAIRPSQSVASGTKILGPDGRYEHVPLTFASVLDPDVATLSHVARLLGAPLDPWDLHDVVSSVARDVGQISRDGFVSLLARLAGVLDLAWTDDTRTLYARLNAEPYEAQIVLTPEEEDAYRRVVSRINDMWPLGSTLNRFVY